MKRKTEEKLDIAKDLNSMLFCLSLRQEMVPEKEREMRKWKPKYQRKYEISKKKYNRFREICEYHNCLLQIYMLTPFNSQIIFLNLIEK